MNILMVCLGNICRSPLAEGLLRSKANALLTVDSAGTSAYHVGEAPDARMIRTARKHGVNLSSLHARQFTVEDFDRFDIIYAMDGENMRNILRLARNESDIQKVRRLLDETYPGEEMDVPDPYFGGDDGFEHVFELLDEATSAIIKKHIHGATDK